MNVKYGLIVTSELLKEKSPDGTYTFAGLTRKTFSQIEEQSGREEALSELGKRILHNLDLTENIIEFIPRVNINHYRVNSSIFSLASDFSDDLLVTVQDLPNYQDVLNKIRSIGFAARENSVTLSVYPDSTNSLMSDSELVIERTVGEINFHSWFFETAGFPSNASNPIIVKPLVQPSEDNHVCAVKCLQLFYKNFKKLSEEAQNRLVIQNEEHGYWNSVNLFKYFHVYLNEKYDRGMILSYYNIADERNLSELEVGLSVEREVNIGAFHETWRGVVPVFLWSEKSSDKSKNPVDYLSEEIPNFNYSIKWECDVKKRDKAIIKFTMPEAEEKVTEEVITTITKNKYKKSRDSSRAFNALYDSVSLVNSDKG
jgi:UV DNA damage repair endonuclease